MRYWMTVLLTVCFVAGCGSKPPAKVVEPPPPAPAPKPVIDPSTLTEIDPNDNPSAEKATPVQGTKPQPVPPQNQ